MKKLMLAGLLVLGFGTLGYAAPLEPGQVAADAKWLVHIDVDGWRNTPLAEKIREQKLDNRRSRRALNFVRKHFGLDLQKDLHGMTMYGKSYQPHTGVLLISADFNRDRIEKSMEKAPMYRKSEHGDYTLHSWVMPHGKKAQKARQKDADKAEKRKDKQDAKEDQAAAAQTTESDPDKGDQDKGDREKKDRKRGNDKGEERTHDHRAVAALRGTNLIVLAGTEEAVKAALDVLDGKGQTLAADSPLVGEIPPGTVMHGAAIDLAGLKEHEHAFPILQQLQLVQVNIGHHENMAFVRERIEAEKPEVAENLQKVSEGFKAMLQLMSSGEADRPDFTKGLEISREQNTLNIDWQLESDTIVRLAEKLMERSDEWRLRRGKQLKGKDKN